MAVDLACQACGVALPERVAGCPSCGRQTGLGANRAWLGTLALALVMALGLAMIGLARRPRIAPGLAGDVSAYVGVSRLVINPGGTEVTGVIDNKGKVPIDVTVRFRAFDVVGHVFAEIESGPHRRIAPGATKSIAAYISATPIEKWEVEITDLAPSGPPE